MDYTCIEIEGAIYQPKNIFPINNYYIIPATKDSSVYLTTDAKLILVFPSECKDHYFIQHFIFSYQFLFLKSNIYLNCSLPGKPISFKEKDDIDNVFNKYKLTGGFKVDFDKIDTFHTSLTKEINFKQFYNTFVEKYSNEETFKNIIDLFLYTIGSQHKFYNNIFQKISQLQTIFETLTGKPRSVQCTECKRDKYNEDWDIFLKRELTEKGLSDSEENELIIKIKTMLNKVSRVKYIHHSTQLNTWQKTMEEIKTGNYHYKDQQTYKTDFVKLLKNKLKMENWSALDWESIFLLYQVIIKRIIFSEYLNN